MAGAEDYIAELLKLTPEERASAARVLLDSLDDDAVNPNAAEEKAAELVRRAKSVRDGTAKLIDGEKARQQVMARLDEIRNQ